MNDTRIAVAGAGHIGLANVRITEAIALAARTGQTVDLTLHFPFEEEP